MDSFSIKMTFLKISLYSHENNSAGVCFLKKMQAFKYWNFIKMQLQHRCFPMNIASF